MQEQGTEDSRWCAFASTLEAFQNNWLFGTGFGTFQDVFPMYRHYECAGIFGTWERAHNFYLEGLLGFGILFAIVGLVGMAALLAILVRGVRVRHRQRFVPVSGLAVFVLTAFHSLVDFSLQIPGFNVYFAAFMAAAVTVSLGK
jgi:O-antigen ligase